MAPILQLQKKNQRRSWLRLISTVLGWVPFSHWFFKNQSSTLFLPPAFYMQFSDTLSVGLHCLHKAQATLLPRLNGWASDLGSPNRRVNFTRWQAHSWLQCWGCRSVTVRGPLGASIGLHSLCTANSGKCVHISYLYIYIYMYVCMCLYIYIYMCVCVVFNMHNVFPT